MGNIDHRRRYFIVLDVETANFVENPLVYDLGFAVVDKHGNIYETKSLMLKELFFDMQDIMATAYYNKKLPAYWEDWRQGRKELVNIYQARSIVKTVIEKYNIHEVYAYNARFDKQALNNTIRYLTKSRVRWFFPYGITFNCIWHMATQTLCKQKSYYQMASANNWISGNGNLITNAEKVYSYISGDNDFSEVHQGLDDVLIEAKILSKVLRQHKKVDKSINRNCWKIPQEGFKEFMEGQRPSQVLKMICFDMDGTIADLYAVNNWESDLRDNNVRPYSEADPIFDMEALVEVLNELKQKGVEIRIITWGAKDSSKEFLQRTKAAKKEWLDSFDFPYNKIHCVQYGTPKSKSIRKSINSAKEKAILIDDNQEVCKSWKYGDTINPTESDIIFQLKEIAASL